MQNDIAKKRRRFFNAWNKRVASGKPLLPNPRHDLESFKVGKAENPQSIRRLSIADDIAAMTPSNEALLRLAEQHPAPPEWYDEDE